MERYFKRFCFVVTVLLMTISFARISSTSVSANTTSRDVQIWSAVVEGGKEEYSHTRFPYLYKLDWEIEKEGKGVYYVTGRFKTSGRIRHFEAEVLKVNGMYRCTSFEAVD